MSFLKLLKSTSGATAVEFSLIALPLLGLGIGVVEVGRTLSVQSNIIHAAEKAQRAVMLSQTSSGHKSNYSAEIEAIIKDTFSVGHSDKLDINLVDKNVEGMSFHELTVSYPVEALLPFTADLLPEITVTRLIPSSE